MDFLYIFVQPIFFASFDVLMENLDPVLVCRLRPAPTGAPRSGISPGSYRRSLFVSHDSDLLASLSTSCRSRLSSFTENIFGS